MNFDNKNRGTVSFVFYFIIALALLAIAGYYIGINEQQKLFKIISDKKQQQNQIEIGNSPMQDIGAPNLSIDQDSSIKSIIDSPYVVLRNLKSNSSIGAGVVGSGASSIVVDGTSTDVGPNVDVNSTAFSAVLDVARKAKYLLWLTDSTAVDVELVNGVATGKNCYTSPDGKVCFPKYKLEKVWAIGDLNKDKMDDALVSVSISENVLQNKPIVSRLFALMSTSTVGQDVSSSSVATSGMSHYVVPLNYGYDVILYSADISEGDIILFESIYRKGDVPGKPSANMVVRHKIEGNAIYLTSEATLFAEQKESTSIWYPYNYEIDGLNFSFKAPDSWQKVESFDKAVKIIFKEKGGRNLVLETRNIVETCSEYNLNLSDSKDVKIKSSEFIDLGQFGVGLYVKYAIININDSGLKQYHADICVTDKNTDKKVFSLYSTTKEDDIPYFSIFDKIWSTFKIVQE
jgi:hypothetical protein